MDDQLLEQLLNEEEGPALDFKRGQYPYERATDEAKAEFLKDILAFANSWRRTSAYILVGVEEVRGGRSIPVGVTHHLSDNDLQQFVNTKTQRPVQFRYIAYPFEGRQLGVIEISQVERPVYLLRQFAHLAAEKVFVRRGSSTDIADPDEIARMGASHSAIDRSTPQLTIEWADRQARQALGPTAACGILLLDPPISPSLIRPRRTSYLAQYVSAFDAAPSDYYDRLIRYTSSTAALATYGLLLRNISGVAAQGVVVSSRIPKRTGLQVLDSAQYPTRPSSRPFADIAALTANRPLIPPNPPPPHPDVTEYDDYWELTVPFGTVLPQAEVWSASPLHLGATTTDQVSFDLVIYAENLPAPIHVTLTAAFVVTCRPMSVDDVYL